MCRQMVGESFDSSDKTSLSWRLKAAGQPNLRTCFLSPPGPSRMASADFSIWFTARDTYREQQHRAQLRQLFQWPSVEIKPHP